MIDDFGATRDYEASDDDSQARSDPSAPRQIARYRVKSVLGEGGFGTVYLATDETLHRSVAVKVPHARLISADVDLEGYLAEARTIAHLDHPNIVPVYDVGHTEDVPFYVVTKHIEGQNLSHRLKAGRLDHRQSSQIVSALAGALHYAHKAGIVHRDVKPGNILLDRKEKPYLVDFGLALRDADVDSGPRYAGTAAYMSPEQARGEGHRVDGRSDIYSLGVVLYQLLTRRQPFRADTVGELLDRVATMEVRPPRQIDDSIPPELERICLKALAKRASERYTTASDLATDLEHLLQLSMFADSDTAIESSTLSGSDIARRSPDSSISSQSQSMQRSAVTWKSPPPRIVPKGLRSFDAHDADFFLELLPGPRDRDGLPDSLRFWRLRLEETEAGETFPVGLLYGPSGCGKTSFVKAGLLPHLSNQVTHVYLEATPSETEARLLAGLRKRGCHVTADRDLVQTIAQLRHRDPENDGKVLIVIDQFEQWLHAASDVENAELTRALRQCDGAAVQCLLMVRDDFWMATTRFMRELEIRLVEGENSAASDLFHPRHARKVLAAFGQALGDLPENLADFSRENKAFIEQAVKSLISDGKVISVRLALFAQMMRGKAWTPTTLRHVGGFEGLGIAFLEETFSESSAPPEHRYHERAVRAILKALLPIADSDIKGHMRASDELLEASGYGDRPRDFDAVVDLLDNQLRLIAPTDPEGLSIDDSMVAADLGRQYYQLSHDYLVPAIREWLTRKLKATRRGRASLRLAELATLWHAKPESTRLPSWFDWARIRVFTRPQTWTEPQRRMMRVATGRHTLRACALLLLVAVAGWGVSLAVARTKAHALVENLKTAETAQIPPLLQEVDDLRWWMNDALQSSLQSSPAESKEHLHASLAILAVDTAQIEYLREQLLARPPETSLAVRQLLTPHAEQVAPWLWDQLQNEQLDATSRFRAALALAGLAPPTDATRAEWNHVSAFVAEQQLASALAFPGQYVTLKQGLRPARLVLLEHLHDAYLDDNVGPRRIATDILLDYAADQPELLAELLLDGDLDQFPQIWGLMKSDRPADPRAETLARFREELARIPDSDLDVTEKAHLASRQAHAAVALLRWQQAADVWPLLRRRREPLAGNLLIHRLQPLGIDPRLVLTRLAEESDAGARRTLLLALGEYDLNTLSPQTGGQAVLDVKDLFMRDPDPGVHTAAEWLLKTWDQSATLEVTYPLLPGAGQREDRGWYRTPSGFTMVVVDGRNQPDIGRVFDVASTEVTLGQIQKYGYHYAPDLKDPEVAAGVVTWYKAIAYCHWLNEQENVPESEWCYPIFNPEDEVLDRFLPDVSRTGYRLLTEAEWVYACRAGTTGRRFFGDADALVEKYVWHADNSNVVARPVGLLKPNDFGLWDMLGNIAEWQAGRVMDDRVTIATSSFAASPSRIEIRPSEGILPRTKYNMYGFRVGRTRLVDE